MPELAHSQPLLIPDDEVVEPAPATPLTQGTEIVIAAGRLVDAARLPTTCYDRGHAYRDALVRLAALVDRMRDTTGDPKDGLPAGKDDARLHFVAPGEIVETVDSIFFVDLVGAARWAETLYAHLNRTGLDLPEYDDHTRAALDGLHKALAAREERVHQLHTLRGDKTASGTEEDEA